MTKSLFLAAFFATLSLPTIAQTIVHVSAQNFEVSLNEAIENAHGPTTIVMPAGRFSMSNELILDKPGLTLKGQGLKATILSFKQQKAGPQGMIGTKDQITFEDFAVEDTHGNAIKVYNSNHVTFRRVKVSWTQGARKSNGAYGLYPVLSRNVLIEGTEVSGASDAGIYVGQSVNIVVRNNRAFGNVAGIEIENSEKADVYGNVVTDNTAGILVFTLPDLIKKDGKHTRVFANKVFDNNRTNFSTKGSIINLVPKGMGVFMLAARHVEIFDNFIKGHSLSNIAIAHYAISERKVTDPTFDPMPRGIHIYSNRFRSGLITIPDGSRMNLIIKLIGGLSPKDVIYDGIDDGTYNGDAPRETDRICIRENTSNREFKFVNLHLDNSRPGYPYPGGPASRRVGRYECALDLIPPVTLETPTALPDPTPVPTAAEVAQACGADSAGVNWGAVEFDCPKLSDYRLFKSPQDPTRDAREGFLYRLNNELFTDYALKDRFVFLPPGKSINYAVPYVLDFPLGTIITKTFSLQLPGRETPKLIETRLLVRRQAGWKPLNYTWGEDQEARLNRSGFIMPVTIRVAKVKDLAINYHVPSLRQCASCHSIDGRIVPIGPKAKFLNHDQQLQQWASAGKLTGLPIESEIPRVPAWNDLTADVDTRAKAYLEINCSHCHNPKGNASPTGLFLQAGRPSNSVEIGYCKTPVAAGFGSGGNKFDIHPGSAKRSILYYRMGADHLAAKMPQLGRSVPHAEGNKLIEEWIDAMAPSECK